MQKSLPRFIREILQQRKITDNSAMHEFLFPKLQDLKTPSHMKGMVEAVELVVETLDRSLPIIIWGDYDVDGTTSTAMLVNFFRALGVEVQWYIPDRLSEGYGVHYSGFSRLHKKLNSNEFLLITVDCGISNGDEIAAIIDLGGKVLVTDHHQLPLKSLPDCVILNPNQEDCGFHSEHLAGVGVAFYLVAAVRASLDTAGYFEKVAKPNLKDYLGYVALGSLADVVPLTQTNRILVRAGMETLAGEALPSLKALLRGADIFGGPLTSEDIGFTLGPRINAAGRLGSAAVAVELLTCLDQQEGTQLSKKLNLLNDKRKSICAKDLETALTLVAGWSSQNSRSVVLQGDFHEGVLGIVASKITEIHKKPTLVFGAPQKKGGREILKGSGRSIPGVDLIETLHKCSDHIDKYGGHAMAAGLSVDILAFDLFKHFFEQVVAGVEIPATIQHNRSNEFNYSVDEILEEQNLKCFLQLEPFGPGNEKPVFVDASADIVSCRVIGGNGEHLQLLIRGRYRNYRGVGFGLGHKYDDIRESSRRRLKFTPMLNRYKGAAEWQLRVLDI